MLEPELEYGVTLDGHLTAHVKPTITFGIDFNKDFIPVDSCAVNLVADGHVTFHAELNMNSESSFCYGVDAGADLYATIDAPSEFKWALPDSPFLIVPVDDVQIYPTGNQPACMDLSKKRAFERDQTYGNATAKLVRPSGSRLSMARGESENHVSAVGKRAQVYGPMVSRVDGLKCPGAINVGNITVA